jgi:hypothetical protein
MVTSSTAEGISPDHKLGPGRQEWATRALEKDAAARVGSDRLENQAVIIEVRLRQIVRVAHHAEDVH